MLSIMIITAITTTTRDIVMEPKMCRSKHIFKLGIKEWEIGPVLLLFALCFFLCFLPCSSLVEIRTYERRPGHII